MGQGETALIDFKGRAALVTGAGQGVGREVALLLASHGAEVVIVNDFHAERAEAVSAEIRSSGGNALAVQADVSDAESVERLFDAATRQAGAIDVLVNNAGNAGPVTEIDVLPPFWETDAESWAPWLDTNLYGVLHCSRAALPGMVERGYGRIVTVISDAARVGDARVAVYAAAKAGAAGFTRAIARGAGEHGVTANCVSLGAIDTPGLAKRRTDPERREKQLRAYPVPRFGQPRDAAATIVFLASDAAAWVTGQTWPVNGGFSFAL